MATKYVKGKIYLLDPTTLQSDPQQPRKFMDPSALAEMAASMRRNGVIEPIIFRQDEAGNLIIVAGERRVAAAKLAGLKTIPGILVQGNHREIALVENLLRTDLIPVEEAEAIEQMMKEFNYSQNQVSEIIGKSQSSINETLAINRLPADLKAQCRTNPNIPKYTLVEIAKGKTEPAIRKAFEKFMARQARPTQTTNQVRLTTQAAMIRKIDTLNGRLVSLCWQDWSDTDKQDLAVVVGDMHQTTELLLRELQGGGQQTPENDEAGGAETDPLKRLS